MSDHFWPEIQGHKTELGLLKNSISRGNIAHAIIFSGPESVGKRLCALEFARMLFEKHNPNVNHKSLLASQSHPDLHFLEKAVDKKEISVEQVRVLLSGLKLMPYHQGAIVAVINDAHLLNKSASNAILKTLEEPNSNTYLLLVTDRPHLLLETIRSRCQPLTFGLLNQAECEEAIRQICRTIEIDPSLAEKLTKITEGSLQSLSLSNFFSRSSNTIENRDELAKHLLQISSSTSEMARKIEQVLSDFQNSSSEKLISHLADLTLEDTNSPLFWQISRNLIRARMRSSEKSTMHKWAKALQDLIQAEFNIQRRSANPQLQLCATFL